MSHNTQASHTHLSVNLKLNGALYPVESFVVEDNRTWNREKQEYIYGPDTLSVTVSHTTFVGIVNNNIDLLNTLTSYDMQGERTKRITLHYTNPATNELVDIHTDSPRPADIECPKCKHLVYRDELSDKWDSARIVLGEKHYGQVCKACWEEYQAAHTEPVQADQDKEDN